MESSPETRSIAISEFRRRCLSLLPELAERGSEIIVTRRGRPLAVVSPVRTGGSDSIYGLYAEGDISYADPAEPYYSDEQWDEIVDAWDANVE